MTDVTDMDRLTAVYIKMRDKKAEIKHVYDASIKDIEDQMALISQAMMDILKQNNQESARTAHGTVTRTVKKRIWTNDWTAMYDFVVKNNVPDFFEKRLCQSSVSSWIEANPDLLPPGLQVDAKYDVSVRRSK